MVLVIMRIDAITYPCVKLNSGMSSNQTAEVVKLLTLITIITTPLMMVGTWYGMNFHDMPELSLTHGYVIASILMITSTIGTYWYFKKKGWLR